MGQVALPELKRYNRWLNRFICFTQLFNATGQPALSLPLHWTPDGLPVGSQFVAPYGNESTLLQLGAQLEEARPWIGRLASLAPPRKTDS